MSGDRLKVLEAGPYNPCGGPVAQGQSARLITGWLQVRLLPGPPPTPRPLPSDGMWPTTVPNHGAGNILCDALEALRPLPGRNENPDVFVRDSDGVI